VEEFAQRPTCRTFGVKSVPLQVLLLLLPLPPPPLKLLLVEAPKPRATAGWTGKYGSTRTPLCVTTAAPFHFSSLSRSTARLEAAALAGHYLRVPVFVDTLIQKILAGDTDAVDLTGTGRALLMGEGAARAPPTAIKAQYFWLNLSSSSSSSSSNSSAWWHRSEIINNPALIYTQAADRCASALFLSR
jgi:hypothetical protein